MVKIAYNTCYGGFGVSKAAVLRGRELSKNPLWGGLCLKGDVSPNGEELLIDYSGSFEHNQRNDPILIQVIEELGDKANGSCAEIVIEEVDEGSLYLIDEHDGKEILRTQLSDEWNIA